MTITIFHNPRCSKSRQTLGLIEAAGHTPIVIEYLKTPPSVQELTKIIERLGLTPRDLMRSSEDAYKELGLKDATLGDQTLIQAMTDHPKLIERPIVLTESQAVIGRPPENVLDIL